MVEKVENGFFLIDKERGKSSFDVIRDLRREFYVKKMGHSGTLDPLATGLLLVAVGKATKLLQYLIGCEKSYEFSAHFGLKSDTYDAEGELVEVDAAVLSQADLLAAINEQFLGSITQVPPKYSALKINGKKACDRVRAGEEVVMKSREVEVKRFDLVDYDWPLCKFYVQCSAGTYIRSLANDLAEFCGSGAYVSDLRRVALSNFSVQDLRGVEMRFFSIEEVVKRNLDFVELDERQYLGLQDGKALSDAFLMGEFEEGKKRFLVAFYQERVVGVLKLVYDCGAVRFAKVL